MATMTSPDVQQNGAREASFSGWDIQIPPGPALAVLMLVWIGAYWPILAWMFPHWIAPRGFYSHGLLVAAVVAYLLWQGRARVMGSEQARLPQIALAVLTASVLWFAAWATTVIVAQILTAALAGWLAASAICGRGALWRTAPYAALLAGTVPLWSPLMPALQSLATTVTGLALRSVGLAVYFEGNLIVTPSGAFSVDGGCSGLGFLLVAGCAVGYMAVRQRLALVPSLLLVSAAILLALVVNWVRIFLIVLSGYHHGAGHWIVSDHVTFGWFVFMALFMPALLLLQSRMPDYLEEPTASVPHRPSVPAWGLLLLAIALGGVPALGMLANRADGDPGMTPELLLPHVAEGSYVVTDVESTWRPNYPHASVTAFAVYQRPHTTHPPSTNETSIYYFSAHYHRQSNDGELISIANDLTGRRWQRAQQATAVVAFDGQFILVAEQVMRNVAGQELVVWYWYQIGNAHAVTNIQAKAHQVLQKAQGRSDATLFALAAACPPAGCELARESLRAFVRSVPLPYRRA